MKKLLVIAAVAAASLAGYYLFVKPSPKSKAEAPLVLKGEWKMDSVYPAPGRDSSLNLFLALIPVMDTNAINYRYAFADSITLYRTLNGTVRDTIAYQLTKDQFIWMEQGDTTRCKVLLKDSSQFVLQTEDSTRIVFRSVTGK
jgi:hypothetical protein